MADLKTNYVDDVLDTSVNEKRKYNMIQNADGTVSFVDVTTYTQNGDSFGAKDVNDTNTAVNELNNNLKQTTIIPEEGIELNTINEKLNYLIENGTGSGSIQYCETLVNQEYKTYTFDKEYKLVVAFVTNGGNANDTINISYTDIEPIQEVSNTYHGKCCIFKDVPVGASITIGTSTGVSITSAQTRVRVWAFN